MNLRKKREWSLSKTQCWDNKMDWTQWSMDIDPVTEIKTVIYAVYVMTLQNTCLGFRGNEGEIIQCSWAVLQVLPRHTWVRDSHSLWWVGHKCATEKVPRVALDMFWSKCWNVKIWKHKFLRIPYVWVHLNVGKIHNHFIRFGGIKKNIGDMSEFPLSPR